MLDGRNIVIKVSNDGEHFYTLTDANEALSSLKVNNSDVTKFSDSWVRRLSGLKDSEFNIKGFLNPSDITGQGIVGSSFVDGADLYLVIFFDGVNGLKQIVVVDNFDVSASVDSTVKFGFKMSGNGEASFVTLESLIAQWYRCGSDRVVCGSGYPIF